MDRVSRQLERTTNLKEWDAAREVTLSSGHLLVTTTLGYEGGNGFEQYFALFLAGTAETEPVLVGWAVLPDWLRFAKQQKFVIRAQKKGGTVLHLTVIDNGGERPNHGKPVVQKYVISARTNWGGQLDNTN